MVVSLEGPRLKLDRAWKHLGDFEAITEPFLASERDKMTIQHETDSTGVHTRLWVIEEPGRPPPEIGPVISDVLHNLRSALDHLATQLTLVHTPTAGLSGTGFPIFDNTTEYTEKGLPMIKGMSHRVRAAIESLQPYHGPHLKWVTHPLVFLNRMNNIYKHREFKLVVLSAQAASGVGLPDGFTPTFNAMEGRTVMAVWPNPAPDVEVYWSPSLDVVLADSPWGDERIGNNLVLLWERVMVLCNQLAKHAGINDDIVRPVTWPFPVQT